MVKTQLDCLPAAYNGNNIIYGIKAVRRLDSNGQNAVSGATDYSVWTRFVYWRRQRCRKKNMERADRGSSGVDDALVVVVAVTVAHTPSHCGEHVPAHSVATRPASAYRMVDKR